MKIVVDTNILVSAILRGRMPRKAIQSIIESPGLEVAGITRNYSGI